MTVHLVKLCVGASSFGDLKDWQDGLQKRAGRVFHTTRMMPARADELCTGGSLYWVIKGYICVRQHILAVERFQDDDGIKRCHIVLDPNLFATRFTARRPFQGWRYLSADAAPADIHITGEIDPAMPASMRFELAALGLL